MKKLAAIVLLAGFIFLGLDVSDADLMADITFTNNTGSSITESALAFPLSTQGLLNGNVIDTDTLDLALVNSSDDQVPMMPSPIDTAMEQCRLDDGGVFSNDLTDCNDADADDVPFVPATPVVDDAFYFGGHWPFRVLRLEIGTAHAATGTAMVLAWEYCSAAAGACSTWTAVSGLQDDSDAYRNSGTQTVAYDMPDDWVSATVDGATSYYLRARVTTAPTGSITQPLGTQVWWDRGIAEAMPCQTCDLTSTSLTSLTLPDNSSVSYSLFTGQSTDVTEHAMFPGTDGYTVTGDASLNLGTDDSTIEIRGYFNTDATGSDRELVTNSTQVVIEWDGIVDGQLDVFINAVTDCTLQDTVSTGFHEIAVTINDSANQCALFVDQVNVDLDLDVTGLVTGGTDDWVFGANNSVVYMTQFGVDADSQVTLTDCTANFEICYRLNDTFTGLAVTDIAPNAPDPDALPSFTVPSVNIGSVDAFESVQTTEGEAASAGSPDIVGDSLSDTPDFTGTPIAGTNLPGGEAVDEFSTIANLPSSSFWLMLGFVVSIVVLAAGFRFTQNIMFSMLLAGVAMMMFVLMGFFEIWMVFVFALIGAAIVLIGSRFTLNA